MASLVVRNLEEKTKEKLRRRATRNGRSLEAEVRAILRGAVESPAKKQSVAVLFAKEFGEAGGVDLDPYLPKREAGREPPSFD